MCRRSCRIEFRQQDRHVEDPQFGLRISTYFSNFQFTSDFYLRADLDTRCSGHSVKLKPRCRRACLE